MHNRRSCSQRAILPQAFSLARCRPGCLPVSALILALTGAWPCTFHVAADALIATRAIEASTIAEIFIDPTEIRLELEMTQGDLVQFHNLLASERPELSPAGQSHLPGNLDDFFRKDLILRAGGPEPLTGRVVEILVRPMARPNIFSLQPEDGSERNASTNQTVLARLVYPVKSPPKIFSVRPSLRGKDSAPRHPIGFIVYQQGLPVMDLQYLNQEETMDLDWADPWFSRFRNPELRRQYDSPLAAFLYVSPFEVRLEIIARPLDLQRWTDLGCKAGSLIRKTEQQALKNEAAQFLAVMNPVTIDGQSPQPVLERVDFIRRSLRQTTMIEPAEDLPAGSATLGVVFSYPVPKPPGYVFMEWELFDSQIVKVPALITDQPRGNLVFLDAANPILEWWGGAKSAPLASPMALTVDGGPERVSFPMLSLLFLVCLVCFSLWLWRRGQAPSWLVGFLGLAGLGAAVLFWPVGRCHLPRFWARSVSPTPSQAQDLLLPLLQNVYRSFDCRAEERIYSVLETSVAGDLLTQVYLETLRSLSLENQGGVRVKVHQVRLIGSEVLTERVPDGFAARCRWRVEGSVGHWGHVHQRHNEYDARLKVQDVGGIWKITGLELLDERRL